MQIVLSWSSGHEMSPQLFVMSQILHPPSLGLNLHFLRVNVKTDFQWQNVHRLHSTQWRSDIQLEEQEVEHRSDWRSTCWYLTFLQTTDTFTSVRVTSHSLYMFQHLWVWRHWIVLMKGQCLNICNHDITYFWQEVRKSPAVFVVTKQSVFNEMSG